MSHSCVEIYLHIIFSTKGRRPLIPDNIENRLYGYFSGIAKKNNALILSINGTHNHIHILLKIDGCTQVSDLVKKLKSYSTSWIKKQGIVPFAWQEGYGAFSCSITHLNKLINYIRNQKEHHKIKTFEEEIERLNRLWKTQWKMDKDEYLNETEILTQEIDKLE